MSRRTTAMCLLFLALSACSDSSSPVANLPQSPAASEAWFSDAAASRGIDFTLETTIAENPHLPEIVAGGGAAIDVDDDGSMDLYLLQASGDGGNVLLRNTGDGTFENVSSGSGAQDDGYGMGAATGD